MRLLALDLSASTGYAILDFDEDAKPKLEEIELIAYGTVKLDGPVSSYSEYPYSHVEAAEKIAFDLRTNVIDVYKPEVVIIEEIQLSRGSRIAQKWLGILHGSILEEIRYDFGVPLVQTVDPSAWRSACGIKLTSEDRRNNKLLKDGKSKAELGIRGKVTQKHLAVRFVNEHFGLNLKMNENDKADAILVGVGYILGAKVNDGK